MKARWILVVLYAILICVLILFNGCSSDSDEPATKSWHNPTNISDNISPDGQDACIFCNTHIWHKQIAMDDNGNIIIVWVQSDGTNKHIFKSERRNGVWTNPISLSDHISPNGQDATEPHVAMDNNGNAVIVWIQSDGSNYQVFKSEHRNGTWHHPADLTDNISPDGQDVGWNDFSMGTVSVAMDNNGNAIVVWYQSDGSTTQIFKSEYRDNVWHHPEDITDNIGIAAASQPQVTMDDNDNAIIVYIASDGSSFQIFKSEYRNGSWHHPASISEHISPDGKMALFPQVAMANNGDAIIVWEQYVTSGVNESYLAIFKSEYRNGSWTNPLNLSYGPFDNGRFPQVEMDNNGNAIIIWEVFSASNFGTFTSAIMEYRNDTWTNRTGVQFNGEFVDLTHMAMDDNGNAIIVWPQSDGSNSQVFKSEDRSGSWHNPMGLSDNISSSGQGGNNPLVAMGNNGEAIIVYQGSDGANSQIFKSEYR